MLIEKLKKMFHDLVVSKDVSQIPLYYHPDCQLFTNSGELDYNSFMNSHQLIFDSPIQFAIEYDEGSLMESHNQVAGRVWVTITIPNLGEHKVEGLIIVLFKEDKIFKIWQLTNPDWTGLIDINLESLMPLLKMK